jgi:hypothetical protein
MVCGNAPGRLVHSGDIVHNAFTSDAPDQCHAGRPVGHGPAGKPRCALGSNQAWGLTAAGIRLVARTVGVEDGKPRLEDGRVLDVRNVVWCTGFGHDFSWIHLPVFDAAGAPVHHRGVATAQLGLYFLGLPFLYGVTSGVVGGVGRDAEFITRHVLNRSGSSFLRGT